MNVICRNDEPILSQELEPLQILDPIDQAICEQVAAVLIRHYPGHDWLVEADRRKAFIDIRNICLDGQMGCRIPMSGYATSSELEKLAMRYGGEILERYNLARGGLDAAALNDLPEDFAGRLRHDQ